MIINIVKLSISEWLYNIKSIRKIKGISYNLFMYTTNIFGKSFSFLRLIYLCDKYKYKIYLILLRLQTIVFVP